MMAAAAGWLLLLLFGCAAAEEPMNGLVLARIDEVNNRVVQAGGRVKGKMGFSLYWETDDDLDLQVLTPSGALIGFERKWADGGTLDVDMCSSMGLKCTRRPVENIRFKAAGLLFGRYKVLVQNFRYKANKSTNRPIKFEVLARMGKNKQTGQKVRKLFRGLCTKANLERDASTVEIFSFDYRGPGDFETLAEAERDVRCEMRLGIEAGNEAGGARLGDGGGPTHAPQEEKRKRKQPAKVYLEADLKAMRIGTLKRTLKDIGGRCRGCTERSELIAAFLTAQQKARDEL